MKDPSIWTYRLTAEDQLGVLHAVEYAERLNKPMAQITASDFPLPVNLLNKIAEWKAQISTNNPGARGFQLVKGVPVELFNGTYQAKLFFWGLGRHMGIPGAQDTRGDLIGDVMDIGGNGTVDRQYKSNSAIAYHCDAADVVGLLCLRPSVSGGGVSRIISSVSVYNELLSSRPDAQGLLRRLTHPVYMDTRGSGGINFIQVSPIKAVHPGDGGGDAVRTYWHREYFRSVYRRFPSHSLLQEALDPALSTALDAYDAVLEEGYRPHTHPGAHLHLDMTLKAGDIQLLSNHLVLHARTQYEDADRDTTSIGERQSRKRHLLRFWLSHPDDYSVQHTPYRGFQQVALVQHRHLEYLQIAKAFVWAKLYS